ncbi:MULTISPECIES: class I SAM-dependent methyltransferase [Bacillus]|uniref:S-adenosyl-L-methionine-dependent methyltransferase n=1 Tax=Bacillus paranthracis TaxID=2026186 RepID=A0AAX3Q4E6_9BACI|nr:MULTISPECIES: class I SAM-dependent methyltransferase [Bacillus cereus group]MBE7115805.1 class I SAM-dependent methyltransferase [Bacillus paranthracis]MBE7133535.1 class I SAM-dependent methyltransferase [Bacillus paranthracis]MBE7155355.1 class I SAM-dependent methyltransferase [Bacillus paranthracis]MCU4850886.1 class I SAM-dependent methyltransferase [Bacillus paranthracis]MDA1743098.1 class I SAM-dependent methyltransferase [Bacillus cereus group sp. LD121LC]
MCVKKGEASITSLVSAFGRAYHSEFDNPKIFDDYVAKEFISQKERNDIEMNMVQGIHFFNTDIAKQFQDNPKEILKWITQVQLSPTPLARAAYCERVLLHEITLGAKQYVILGAGLDTFSFRHRELENKIEVFEVDHPSTQQFKKERIKEAELEVPNNLHFVSMDFTKGFSYEQLQNEGFENKKTFFSLLGVTYYLTKEELSSLIECLFEMVPEGSSIVFDYPDENLFTEKGLSNRVENMVKMAAVGGEPMKSCFSYTEMEALLEKAGLLIYEHLSPEDINTLYFEGRKDYLEAFETVHYVHAVKK